jgi:indole-3-glycerol phosphate synthase
VNAGRRFSQAVAEGDGISLIARVQAPDDAARVEENGAEAVLVAVGNSETIEQIRAATSLPVVSPHGRQDDRAAGADACIVDVEGDREWLDQIHDELRETCEIAYRIDDEEHLESALEEFDPEIFVLAAPGATGEQALERVLDLLPDVPAGKLAIAELVEATRDDVGALERAGFDGVIVEPRAVAELVEGSPPEV